MEINFYVHIGDAKTGSSAIQNFLDLNRTKLFYDFAYLYPNFNAPSLELGRWMNHFRDLDTEAQQETFIEDLGRLIAFCEEKNIQNVILSCEDWLVNYAKRIIPVFQDLIRRNDNISIKPICYLRRIDHWVQSAWKQWGLKKNDSIEEFLFDQKYSMRYKRISEALEFWEDIVGKENIIVLVYEKDQLQKNLINDFLSIVGLDYSHHDWIPNETHNAAINLGFNRDVLELLHLSRQLFPHEHSNKLFDSFSRLLGTDFQKKSFEPYNLLSPKQRIELILQNSAYEEIIAKKYLGRESGILFLEDYPDENDAWVPYKGLTLDKLIPILIKMIVKNEQDVTLIWARLVKVEEQLAKLDIFTQKQQELEAENLRRKEELQAVHGKIENLQMQLEQLLKQ